MSTSGQAKAARRKARSDNAHMGGAMGVPHYKYGGRKQRSVAESIAAARRQAAREAARKVKK